jgi:hypothetical protein
VATEAVLETLRRLWQVVREAKLSAAVVGGLAMAAWRYPRATRDVDLLVLASGNELTFLVQRLVAAGFKPKKLDPVNFGDTKLMEFFFEPPDQFIDVQVDLLLAESEFARKSLTRTITLPAAALGFEVDVLGCEDLIVLKLLAGRIIDQADAAALIHANADALDRRLLYKLAAEAGVADALTEAERQQGM